jgi:hypothetical protein
MITEESKLVLAYFTSCSLEEVRQRDDTLSYSSRQRAFYSTSNGIVDSYTVERRYSKLILAKSEAQNEIKSLHHE